ncbi:MAG: autotransporter outer membrane beta-barrel domain-containing protein, partial [Gammaproteobacteria bacterium]
RRFTINLTAASATDSNYDGLTATATGANDDDETAPAKLTLRAHPSAIPETAGAVDVVVVASFDSGVSVLSATTVTLSAPKDGDAPGDLVADSSTDYAAAPAIARATITIPARMSAGFATFRITPADDMLPDPGEKIVISGAAAGSDVAISGAANITDAEITLTEKGLAQVAAVVNRTLLPVTSQRGLAGAMADIESRAGATRDSRTNYTLAGHASTQSALLGYLKAAADAADGDVRYDWKRALADSSFVMPLNGGGGGAVWAAGDYGALDGESNQVEWEGDVFGMNFGADTRVGGALLGAMVSFVDSEAEYTDSNAGSVNRGTYTQRTTSLRPYFAWASGATEVWGSIGGGAGSVEFIDTGPGALTTKASSDISEASLSLGLKRRLGEGFSLKADAALLASRVDEKKDREGRVVVDKQEIESARTRLLLDSRKTYSRANGEISPSMQVGLRYDVIEDERRGIDSEQGSAGVEVVLGMDFVNFASGLTLSGKARIYDGEDYDEWGVSGSIILQPSGGRGLSLRMRPLYGDAQSSVRRVWERDFGEQPGGAEPDYAASMRGEIGYAFSAPGGRGLLTPYTEATLGGAAANHRLGLRWQPHSRFDVDAHGENRDAANDYRINFHWAAKRRFDFTLSAERSESARVRHAVMLKGAVEF